MPLSKDLSGRKFGRLTVIKRDPDKNGHSLCRCECGAEICVFTGHLKNGHTKSCGCLKRDALTTHGAARVGMVSAEFRTWQNILARCSNPNLPQWKDWGGRGITICDRWRGKGGFANFMADIGPRPSGGRWSIERIDNDGDYEPGNVMWIPLRQQHRNKRTNRLVTFNGATRTMAEWDEVLGFAVGTVCHRMGRMGWSVEMALTVSPADNCNRNERGQYARIEAYQKSDNAETRTPVGAR